jgi:tartrate dehydratase beta subunit/fumarate hydratase class I family protein
VRRVVASKLINRPSHVPTRTRPLATAGGVSRRSPACGLASPTMSGRRDPFLTALLRSFEDVALVGEAASGKDAIALIKRERPGLALLYSSRPSSTGSASSGCSRKDSCR